MLYQAEPRPDIRQPARREPALGSVISLHRRKGRERAGGARNVGKSDGIFGAELQRSGGQGLPVCDTTAGKRRVSNAHGERGEAETAGVIALQDGRRAFGADPESYERARPDYPPEVLEWLRAAAPRTGGEFFEVGPGTGAATELLLRLAPARITALEPDARMSGYLRRRFRETGNVEVVEASFEEAELPEAAFDLGAAATCFHWLEQETALAKAFARLRRGGWWCMWWNVFGSIDDPDAFEEATTPLFRELTPSPSWTQDGRSRFALDEPERRAQLTAAGFRPIEFHRLRWTATMDTARAVALTATFAQVSLAEPARRARFLEALTELLDRQFGGRVERRFCTGFYAAQRP